MILLNIEFNSEIRMKHRNFVTENSNILFICKDVDVHLLRVIYEHKLIYQNVDSHITKIEKHPLR